MDGRIGDLHVRYRTPRGSVAIAAGVPAVHRALAARLGDAIGERLAHVLPQDAAVIVVRELSARVTLGPSDWTLDARAIDRISRASCAALADVLHADPPPDLVMRFDDEPAFIGSFIVDLLGGTAWDRWYFGAFQRYRDGEVKSTLAAVLEDHRHFVPLVFAWLARRGRLAAVLALIGAAPARRLVTGATGSDAAAPADIGVLVHAAKQLLHAMGWGGLPDDGVRDAVAAYLATSPVPPSWSERRSLSAWVLACADGVAAALLRAGFARPGSMARDCVHSLLAGPLDWLDGPWIEERVLAERGSGGRGREDAAPSREVLAASHQRALSALARFVEEGRAGLDRGTDGDALVVRLVASLAEICVNSAALDRALIVSAERIAAAWVAIRDSPAGRPAIRGALHESPSSNATALDPHLAGRIAAVRAMAPPALAVLRALVSVTMREEDGAAQSTPYGGLFLLVRGVLDVRLQALTRDAGVPFDLLLAGLAAEWFAARPPYDAPTALWVGRDDADRDALMEHGDGLAALRDALVQALVDQRCLDAPPVEVRETAPMAAIAWLVIRAWSRWLPGLAAASVPFLIGKGLTRQARVTTTKTTIDVALAPAPLDVVLQMAGYLRPLETVAWLDGRRVVFSVRPLA
jgi:hypothetical protein